MKKIIKTLKEGCTALMNACGGPGDKVDIIDLLLESGAQLDAVDNVPFMWSSFINDVRMEEMHLCMHAIEDQ